MDKFIVKKLKLWDNERELSASTAGFSLKVEVSPGPSSSKDDKGKKGTYLDSYLAYGFSWNKDQDNPRPV